METEPAYLEALDQQLLDQPEAMLVSQLDGFLTGIVVSPDLITPGRWIPLIWAGDEGDGEPEFESEEDLQAFLNLVMTHYHAIIDRWLIRAPMRRSSRPTRATMKFCGRCGLTASRRRWRFPGRLGAHRRR
jgi:hypothetical protein